MSEQWASICIGVKSGEKSTLKGWKVQSKCMLQIGLAQCTQQNFALLSTCFIWYAELLLAFLTQTY